MKLLSIKYFLMLVIMTAFLSSYTSAIANIPSPKSTSVQIELKALEHSFDGRIGIYAINTKNKQSIKFHSNVRFPIQSTFKFIVVADILKKSMKNPNLLKQKIMYNKSDLVFWSPVTKKHVSEGMTIAQLCAAAMEYSDNTATNLLMKKLGGPKAITAFARSIDKHTTFTLENWEPNLNSNPKNLNDTATPSDMAKSLQTLALSQFLAAPQRKQLIAWMENNTTGNTRIRAYIPAGWRVADKTGTGSGFGISNDIGIIWPPKNNPIIIAIYTVQNKKEALQNDRVVAQAARIVLKDFQK